jgi:hypothetical protein
VADENIKKVLRPALMATAFITGFSLPTNFTAPQATGKLIVSARAACECESVGLQECLAECKIFRHSFFLM